tara:strand:+ start:1188 stop:1430 length:243 start_codon:yes stop_codon:yes gene_type:complete
MFGVECVYNIFSADVRCEKGYTMQLQNKEKLTVNIEIKLTEGDILRLFNNWKTMDEISEDQIREKVVSFIQNRTVFNKVS